MIITNLSEGCFRLQSGEISLLLDPSGNRLKADVLLHSTLNPAMESMELSPDKIAFPGEYEVKGIEIEGYGLGPESSSKLIKTAYRVTWEDTTFALLGQASDFPESKILEHMGDIDVLILAVAEDHFFAPEEAMKIIKQIEPKVIIPSFADSKTMKALSKAMGQDAEEEEKFVFKKKDLPLDHTELVLLSAK